MEQTAVFLYKGKEKAVKNRHHWIFSGAVRSLPSSFENGSILPVRAADGEFLGHAYFNRECSIIGRMVNFDDKPPLEAIADNFDRAISLRRTFFDSSTAVADPGFARGGTSAVLAQGFMPRASDKPLARPLTNAYRLVNGEGDGLPGLIADLYHDVLVLQISTLGMERLKPFVLDLVTRRLAPRVIYEKSNLPSRREEGLGMFEGNLRGESVGPFEILENGLRFLVEIVSSQKTGFYLDQRESRLLVRSLAGGRKVLNAFSYTGGFSVFALAGGAVSVDSVDSSERALNLARENCRINGYDSETSRFYVADVFDFIRERTLDFDFIILDPPAFAKRKSDVTRACRGYKDIHRLIFQKALPRSLVLTFSCSFFVTETLFQQVLFQAAREASRNVRILQRHHQAYDHPVNLYHPESNYLKGFLLYVE